MRARWVLTWLSLAACTTPPASEAGSSSEAGEENETNSESETGGGASEQRGAALYQQYCEFCHGDEGLGYVSDNATALANPKFLRIADDELLATAIRYGRPGTVMSAWGEVKAGPLSDADIDDLVAFLRTWQTEPRGDGDE